VKSCRACKVLRQLAPDKVPASCESCQPAKPLLLQNLEAWDLACRYAGLFRTDGFTGRIAVDYPAARIVAAEEGLPDPLWFVEQLEAVARGVKK